MLGLAFVAVGSFSDDFLLVSIFVFALQALSSPAPVSFSLARTSSEVPQPGASPSSPSLPSEGRDERGGGSRDALVLLPEGLPLLPLDFCPARAVEETLDARSLHASSLVSSVHSWTGEAGFALLRRTPATRSVPVGSSFSSLHALRDDGVGESSEAFSVPDCLSRLISAHSARW